MKNSRKVDLVFPRSGQVFSIYVPDTMVDWVLGRNVEVVLSQCKTDSIRAVDPERIRRVHPQPVHS
jgi:hypothetical protein